MKGGGFVSFGDFNNDGHVDGRDYALFKTAAGNSDTGGSAGGSDGGGCGGLTLIVVILVVYGIIKLFGG